MNFFKILKFLSEVDKSFDQVPQKEQESILYRFPEPKSDFHRSFFQYKCQRYFSPWYKNITLDVISCLSLPIIVFLLFGRGLWVSFKSNIEAIGEFKGIEEIIPNELKKEYIISNEVWNESLSLKKSDLKFIWKMLLNFPFYPYFILKVVLKIASYSYLIETYRPKAMIVHGEYSYSSSILTYYCEENNIKHINTMHGEKIYYIGYSFFRYSKCYIWDEHYEELLKSLRAYPNQFIIAIPPALKIDNESNYSDQAYADVKYYLQIFNETKLMQIIDSMKGFERMGLKVVYRPHPRFSDIKLLEKYVSSSQIENPQEVSILTSVASSKYAIGYCSTVLYQAYLAGKKVILDDVAYKIENAKLAEYKYILSNKSDVQILSLLI